MATTINIKPLISPLTQQNTHSLFLPPPIVPVPQQTTQQPQINWFTFIIELTLFVLPIFLIIKYISK